MADSPPDPGALSGTGSATSGHSSPPDPGAPSGTESATSGHSSPPDPGAPSGIKSATSGRSSPPDPGAPSGTGSATSGHSSPLRRKHSDLDDDILKGAAWAPPFTQQELHAREVYERSKTPPPPCGKYKRDVVHDETNPNVVKKRQEDEKKTIQEAKDRHKHGGLVMQRAREFERKCRMECEKNAKRLAEYQGRMKKREKESKGPFKNRAEQIIALGLNKSPSSRPSSRPGSPKPK